MVFPSLIMKVDTIVILHVQIVLFLSLPNVSQGLCLDFHSESIPGGTWETIWDAGN